MNIITKQGVTRICNILAASLLMFFITLHNVKAVELRADADTNAAMQNFNADTRAGVTTFIPTDSPYASNLQEAAQISARAHRDLDALSTETDNLAKYYKTAINEHLKNLSFTHTNDAGRASAAEKRITYYQISVDKDNQQVILKIQAARSVFDKAFDQMLESESKKRAAAIQQNVKGPTFTSKVVQPTGAKSEFLNLYMNGFQKFSHQGMIHNPPAAAIGLISTGGRTS